MKKEIFESKGRKYFNCFKISQLYLKRFSNVEEELIIYISPGSSVNIFHFESEMKDFLHNQSLRSKPIGEYGIVWDV